MNTLRAPQDCQSMAELREQIDALDIDLIRLLEVRSRYIDRAIDLKQIEGVPARAKDRVAEVLDKVSASATAQGLDPALARTLWTEIIEWSIAREVKVLGDH